MEELSFWVGIIASAAFAITGVLAISERGVDLFGVLVLGIITAIGGGTMRDVIMGVPVFWADAPIYIMVAAIASILTFYAESTLSQPQVYKAILYIDGLGAALFAIQGADKAWRLLLNYFPEYAIPGSITCILLIFFFRSAAIYWNLTVPTMFISRKN